MKNSIKLIFVWMAVSLTWSHATNVVITARVPIEHMDSSGQVDGATMSNVGSSYLFLKLVSGKVYLSDPQGGSLVIDLAATDYRPPVVATPSPSPSPSPSLVSFVPHVNVQRSQPLTDAEIMANKLNQALGFTLFNPDKSLWDEDATAVGNRIGWSADSISSFRRYDERPALKMHLLEDLQSDDNAPQKDPSITVDNLGNPLANCLGCHAYCTTLYTRHGKPDFLSLIFANNGDIGYIAKESVNQAETTKIISRDATYLQKTLTQILGDFTESGFGASSIREHAKRWDWNGTSVLLIHSADRYVGVIICPTDFADAHGIRPDRDSNDLKANLVNNLKNSDNGDVYITNIPYVDQGEKGYCVPATWERYLRYLDIPSDMYFFATAGGTQWGGGTSTNAIRDAMADYLVTYQTHMIVMSDQIDIKTMAKYIDKGLPVMWTCWYTDGIEEKMRSRARLRENKSLDSYLAREKLDISKLKDITIDRKDTGHERLIIGYNLNTNEVAISDSWNLGRFFWISLPEAQAEDAGDMTVLQ